MYRTLLETLRAEVSGAATKNLVAHISQYHRIQASPMYRAAAHWLHATLGNWGLASNLESYPAREGVRAWSEPMFQEWSCERGTLDLILRDGSSERLADYRAVPLSLLPRSIATDGEYEVVIINGGSSPEDYDGVDVRGKLVLSRSMPMSIHHLAIERFGAVGLIFDGMRSIPEICPPGDLQDDIQYASWWWWGGEVRAFGFALSPRAGADLRHTVERNRSAGRATRVRASIQARFSDGAIEVVEAHIPGETNEQVLLVGHLCHPAPFANDNASGAAAVMEATRALHTLIEHGRLPRPRRTIRCVWMPEMTGTYAYLAGHATDLPRTVAGLNLDMVGEDQAQCGSVWLITRNPESAPSFAADLLEAMREGLFPADGTPGYDDYPLFRHAVTPFSTGSDHYIMSDPLVGVPTPMMIQWPDRFYHTTADTLEKVSPVMLGQATALAAAYIYFVANAGEQEAAWLAHEMNSRFAMRLARELQNAVTAALAGRDPEGPAWARRVAFRIERHKVALASLTRLAASFDVAPAQRAADAIAEGAWARVHEVLDGWRAPDGDRLAVHDAALVPLRRYPGPISVRPHLRRLPADEQEAARVALRRYGTFMGSAADIALFWADGQRTLAEILDLTELETGVRSPAGLLAFMRLLERLELLELR